MIVADVLGFLLSVFLLIVAVWALVFGGVGALLASSRGSSAPVGIAWGVLLGPLGWLVILWITRSGSGTGPLRRIRQRTESLNLESASAQPSHEVSAVQDDHDEGGRLI